MIIFSFSLIELAVVESAVHVDGIAFAVWQSVHPVALIVCVFALDVVSVHSGVISFDVYQLFV